MLAWLPAGDAQAQAQQTAESAQQFLSLLLANRNVSINAFFQNVDILQTTRHLEDKSKYAISIEQIETVTENTLKLSYRPSITAMAGDAGNACSTVVSELAFQPQELQQLTTVSHQPGQWLKTKGWYQEVKRQDPRVVLAPPHRIDWGKAQIVRWPDGSGIGASNPHPRFGLFSVAFATADAELLDRIEYAMKFLQMSCDPTAGTGF
ncbi:hypothetical protein VA603_09405 [Stenotrophomonas sp. MH1]|uniref:Uncharacterized protein n=1 Tax=Stenotrophomonas capsici TaxID=3110230 RepID=A0ABU5V5C3_9GAMM|nr:hypothetical protein [Stenotrophomonas sp. MH1]MEA5667745.1 hypothetical protein [Stenotrophomonas sp. MH1]